MTDVVERAKAVLDGKATPSASLCAELVAEVEKLRRGGKTLGEIIESQCRMALDATGLHHLVDETGDGDWGLVWENLFEMRAEIERLVAELGKGK